MELLSALAELIRLWLGGADWQKIQAAGGFPLLMLTLAWSAPTTIIGLGLGIYSWRELPVAAFLGFSPQDPNDDPNWAERARDLDKDGIPDI